MSDDRETLQHSLTKFSQCNVLVSDVGTAYIGNFDFQPLQDPERDFDDARRWNAPELQGSKRTTKSDVFSFAMLAYEVIDDHSPNAAPRFAI